MKVLLCFRNGFLQWGQFTPVVNDVDYKNERMNEIFTNVIYNNIIRIRVFKTC